VSEPTHIGPVHAEVDPDALRQAMDAPARQGVTVQRAIDLIVTAGGGRMGGKWAPLMIVTARAGYTNRKPGGYLPAGKPARRVLNASTLCHLPPGLNTSSNPVRVASCARASR
jgi:hypothetical protein